MSTKDQLHLIWEAQFELFDGLGQPKENLESGAEQGGFVANKIDNVPLIPRRNHRRKPGIILGQIESDPAKMNFRLLYNLSKCGPKV